MMIEQPLAWDDMYHHSKLQPLLKTPIAWTNASTVPDHAEAALSMAPAGLSTFKLADWRTRTRKAS